MLGSVKSAASVASNFGRQITKSKVGEKNRVGFGALICYFLQSVVSRCNAAVFGVGDVRHAHTVEEASFDVVPFKLHLLEQGLSNALLLIPPTDVHHFYSEIMCRSRPVYNLDSRRRDALLPPDGASPAHGDGRGQPVQGEGHQGLLPLVLWPGGDLRRHEGRPQRSGLRDHELPGPRLHARHGRAHPRCLGRADRPLIRLRSRQGRLHAHVRQELLRRERHCRRSGAPRRWHRSRLQVQGRRRSVFRSLRRRRRPAGADIRGLQYCKAMGYTRKVLLGVDLCTACRLDYQHNNV